MNKHPPKKAFVTPVEIAQGGSGSVKPRFDPNPFDEVNFEMEPSYLIKGILPRVGLTIVWGGPKCGKSFLVFDMVMHVALGWKYRGRKIRQGSVIYCALEGCTAFKNRVVAFKQSNKERLAEHKGKVPFHMISQPIQLVPDHADLIASIRATTPIPAIVVIDTLNRSLTGSESSDEDMSAYVKAADLIRDAFNCLVVIVHHCGHEGTRPRGHSSLIGALDAQIAVKRDEADNIIATVELLKDGLQGDEFSSRLQIIEVGKDIDGDEVTSCVIEAVEGATPRRKLKTLPAGAAKALKALHEILDDAGIIPPADPYIPPGTKAVIIAEWRAQAFKRGIGGGELKLAQQAFRRAFNYLLDNHRVAVSEPYAWPL